MDKELLKNVLDDLKKGDKDYFQTGFENLDSLCKIQQNGAFILIGGRPSMGKTAFILSIIHNIAPKQEKILMFSGDYSKEQLIKRLLFLESETKLCSYYNKKLDNDDFKALANSLNKIAEWDIAINDNTAIELSDIEKSITELKPKVVFIDGIDWMQLVSDKSNKNSALETLQKLAQEEKCIIFATTTLTRAPENRKNHRPMLSDLKEFRSTQYADIVLLIYREEYYGNIRDINDKRQEFAEIIIEKNRYNPKGSIRLEFDSKYAKFYEIKCDVF